MTTATLLLILKEAVIPAVVSVVGFFVTKLTKEKSAAENHSRMMSAARIAVMAAEEIGVTQKWTGNQKLSYVKDALRVGFPSADDAVLTLAAHAALMSVGIGATSLVKNRPLPKTTG